METWVISAMRAHTGSEQRAVLRLVAMHPPGITERKGPKEQASTVLSQSEEPQPEDRRHIPPVAEEKCASPSTVLQTKTRGEHRKIEAITVDDGVVASTSTEALEGTEAT